MAKRMKLIDYGGTVLLMYRDRVTDKDVERTFWVTTFYVDKRGSHVREATLLADGVRWEWDEHKQVCEHLRSSGNVLWANSENLASVIRREYKRMRAKEMTDRKFSWSP